MKSIKELPGDPQKVRSMITVDPVVKAPHPSILEALKREGYEYMDLPTLESTFAALALALGLLDTTTCKMVAAIKTEFHYLDGIRGSWTIAVAFQFRLRLPDSTGAWQESEEWVNSFTPRAISDEKMTIALNLVKVIRAACVGRADTLEIVTQ